MKVKKYTVRGYTDFVKPRKRKWWSHSTNNFGDAKAIAREVGSWAKVYKNKRRK